MYAVTNSHVVNHGATVVRLNTKDGFRAIHDIHASVWTHHPDGDDLAVCPLPLTDAHRYQALDAKAFLITREFIAEHQVGVGDDVYMVGRFINHEGRQQNAPSVRFGNIARMNDEPILSESGKWQESFLIEGRSVPGYSGSPVFLWLYLGNPRPGQTVLRATWFHRVLGVDWCHLNQEWTVRDRNGAEVADDDGRTPGYHVRGNTGMMGVIPAWKLWDLLDAPDVVEERKNADDEYAKRQRESGVSLDSETT